MKILTNLDLRNCELQNVVIQKLEQAPSSAMEGQIYYNTLSHNFFIYNNSKWIPLPSKTSELENDSEFTFLTSEQIDILESMLNEGNIVKSVNGRSFDEYGNIELSEINEFKEIINTYLDKEQISLKSIQAK